jgi:hypothetical protein
VLSVGCLTAVVSLRAARINLVMATFAFGTGLAWTLYQLGWPSKADNPHFMTTISVLGALFGAFVAWVQWELYKSCSDDHTGIITPPTAAS